MNQKELALGLRIGIGIICVIIIITFIYLIPHILIYLKNEMELTTPVFSIILVLAESAILPCICALVSAWKITIEISKDNSFSKENVRNMKGISFCTLAEGCYLSVAFIIMAFVKWLRFERFTMHIFILALIAYALFVAAICLTHLIDKAANIREENDSIV